MSNRIMYNAFLTLAKESYLYLSVTKFHLFHSTSLTMLLVNASNLLRLLFVKQSFAMWSIWPWVGSRWKKSIKLQTKIASICSYYVMFTRFVRFHNNGLVNMYKVKSLPTPIIYASEGRKRFKIVFDIWMGKEIEGKRFLLHFHSRRMWPWWQVVIVI